MGQKVYERDYRDPIAPDFFEHEIILIDVDNRVLTTKDHSQRGMIVELHGFETVEELEKQGIKFEKNEVLNTTN